MKILSITIIGSGTELTIEKNGNIIKAKTYLDFDGYDKVNVDGEIFKYYGGFTLIKG